MPLIFTRDTHPGLRSFGYRAPFGHAPVTHQDQGLETGIAPSNLREKDVTLDTTRLASQARSPCDRWRNQAPSQG